MISLGLSAAEQRQFHNVLTGSHAIRIQVDVLTLEGEVITSLDNDVEDGQVTVDSDAEINRQATVTLFDPNNTMPIDSDSPANGALFMDRMVRIWRGVKAPGTEWVDVPIFTGPITSIRRTGDSIEIEASGKEILAMGSAFRPRTYRKGLDKVDVIRRIMSEYAGETRMDIPDNSPRISKAVSLHRESVPWEVVQRIAASMDRQLFYDGRGRLRMRKLPGNIQWQFRDGNGGSVIGEPEMTYSIDDVINAVLIKGGEKKTGKKNKNDADNKKPKKPDPVRLLMTAPRAHPLSPWRLGVNGTPRFLLEVVDNGKIRSKAEAHRVARTTLNRGLNQSVTVTLDSLVIPHIEEGDLCKVDAGQVKNLRFRVEQFAIPLTTKEPMSVGYVRNVSPKRRRRKRN